MNTKFTLLIDKSVIQKAKQFANDTNQSLSKIVETYLSQITSDILPNGDPELELLRGIVKLPDNFNLKEEISSLRNKKHG